jgi:transcriptional regulator with XRE-family HTH domain
MNINGDSQVNAWCKYKKMMQAEFADKMGITQAVVSQLEQSSKPHKASIKLAYIR